MDIHIYKIRNNYYYFDKKCINDYFKLPIFIFLHVMLKYLIDIHI